MEQKNRNQTNSELVKMGDNVDEDNKDMEQLITEICLLKEEYQKKDGESIEGRFEKLDSKLLETKMKLDETAVNTKTFHRFSLFPPEIRHIIYSKMPLSDRISAAKATQEMESYFTNHRVKNVFVNISVKEDKGDVYIRSKFSKHFRNEWNEYVEFHRIPDYLVHIVQGDLQSVEGCSCQFCDDCEGRMYSKDGYCPEEKGVVRYLDYDPQNVNAVFETFRLVKTSRLEMKSAPIGGLVDLLVPIGQLREPSQLHVHWLLQEDVQYLRHDPNISIDRWEKWFDFARPNTIDIFNNLVDEVMWSADEVHGDSGYVYIPKEFYDLKAFHNAEQIYQSRCAVDINFRQLISMRANDICLPLESKLLTPFDLLVFHKLKIKEWLSAPDTRMRFCIDCEEESRNPPHLNFQLLLADVREELESPDFRVYPQNPETSGKSISIKSMKTGHSLSVYAEGLLAGSSSSYIWLLAEKYGL